VQWFADPVVESFNALQFQRLRVSLITALQCKHQQRRNEFHPILSPINFATHFQQHQQPNFCCCCCNEREAAKHHCQEKKKKVHKSRKTSKNLISVLPCLASFLDYKNISNPPPTKIKTRGEKKSMPPHKRKEEIRAITTAYFADSPLYYCYCSIL
jgi:hypothetical protein